MKKILSVLGGLPISIPTYADDKIIDMGTGIIADSIIEPIVQIILESSTKVMKVLILISIMLMILDIVFASLNALIQEKYTNFVAQMGNKVITYMMTLFIMSNWFSGYKIFENYIFKPMFIYIPTYLTGTKVDLDGTWDILMSIPNLLWNLALYILSPVTFLTSGWIILIMIGMAIVLYIMIIAIFVRIGTSILHMFIIALFSFITFPFNFFEKLSVRYGGVMIKTYLILNIQFSILFVVLLNLISMARYIVTDVIMGNIALNILFAPIIAFIVIAMLLLLVKFTNKILDILANISTNI